LFYFAMRSFFGLFVAAVLTCALSVAASAQTPQNVATSEPVASIISTNEPVISAGGTAKTAESIKKIVLVGKITNPAGAAAGAVVILTATKQMAVTNADGEFEFVVPANAGALQARVTYAGFEDEALVLNAGAAESTANLSHARVVVVSRKQQLKVYLKTARKQVKRDLRKVRR
jgi:hypothetical protein